MLNLKQYLKIITSNIKNILYRLSLIDDYIVAHGTSGNTTYRKWNSGVMEQWYDAQVTQAINTVYGSLYIGNHTWTFPVAFKAAPIVICGRFWCGTGASWGTSVATYTNNTILRGFDVVSRSTGEKCNISAYAIGRWK